MAKFGRWLSALGVLALGGLSVDTRAAEPARADPLPLGENAWSDAARGTIRGVTIGPIESALHPNRGYGSEPFERTLHEAERLGSTWVSLTPFARVYDRQSTVHFLSFEAPFADNRRAIVRAIRQAHARGLASLDRAAPVGRKRRVARRDRSRFRRSLGAMEP